jgi:AcrR family transcriptional regulator
MQNKKIKLDPRVRRTRKMLRNALEELIINKPYSEILIQDITNQADLDRTTFYLHFKEKQDLLLYTIDEIFVEIMEGIPPMSSFTENFQVENPPLWLIKLFDAIAARKEFFKHALSSQGVAVLFTHMIEYMASQIAIRISQMKRNSKSNLVPESFVVNYLAGSYLGVILWWVKNNLPCSPEEAAYYLMHIIVDGFYTSLGVEPPTLKQ